jgi:hypothetical protein
MVTLESGVNEIVLVVITFLFYCLRTQFDGLAMGQLSPFCKILRPAADVK